MWYDGGIIHIVQVGTIVKVQNKQDKDSKEVKSVILKERDSG